MSHYRRYFVAGGSYFFTVVTHSRRRFLCDDLARRLLRSAILTVQKQRPFEMPGIVLLPDHLHAIWTLPPGDADYPTRWKRIKEEFTRTYLAAGGTEVRRSASRRRRGGRGVWQRRYWEHTLRDVDDFERHLDYIHYNPVRHGLVICPHDWPCSSLRRWVARGVYDAGWGCLSRGTLDFSDLDETAIE
ncbi:MAG: REP-associated tyrosine transposase [Planctomycetaceae bacterium]